MANKTIAELTEAGDFDGSEIFHLVQGGNSRKSNFTAALEALKWMSKGIGELYWIDSSMTGAEVPPSDSSLYRYILLTAGEDGVGEYNEGLLTSESVTGSAPLVVATAVIDDATSPLDGETVNLINTEGRFIRASTSPGTVQNDQMQTITGSIGDTSGVWPGAAGSSGAFSATVVTNNRPSNGSGSASRYDFSSANSPGARTGTETRPKNIGLTAYMRIR